MKATSNKTSFVKKMRSIRDKFSHEIMDITFEQEKEYIRTQLSESKKKRTRQATPVIHHAGGNGSLY